MPDNDVERVAAGYDAVYAGLHRSPSFQRVWREHGLGPAYPEGFEHISFLTLDEMRWIAGELHLSRGGMLVDLACGMGGPGLWIAQTSGAALVGIDISNAALRYARERAEQIGMSQSARFAHGTFAETGLESGSANGVMTVDALQYAPDKQAAVDEVARILRPGGRFAFAAFALERARVAGVPIFGTDPVGDYAPLLDHAGFTVISYDESDRWEERVTAAYQGVIDARAAVEPEMGETAFNALFGEMSLTLQLRPYRSRVLVSAEKR